MNIIHIRKITKRLGADQSGMASILITIIMMIVISLIVLGFAQVSRREQRDALDRQLSTQAFYAAESGVNDAITALQHQTTLTPQSTCDTTPSSGPYYPYVNGSINSATNVGYTCLLVDPTPTTLTTTVDSSSQVLPIRTSGLDSITSITLTLAQADQTQAMSTCPTNAPNPMQFPPATTWKCPFGVLRFDLVPIPSGSLSSTSLLENTMSGFMVTDDHPATNPNPTYQYVANGSNTKDPVYTAECMSSCPATNRQEQITINNLPSTNNFYLRVSLMYASSEILQVTADDSSGTSLQLEGAQVVIDSTGKAQDVLRRIRVAVPLTTTNSPIPGYAIQTTNSICKRFTIIPGGSPTPDSTSGYGGDCATSGY